MNKDAPDDQSTSSPDVFSLSEQILGHWGGWEAELGETWSGCGSDHRLRAGGGKGGSKRGDFPASMGRVYKGK